MDDPLNEIKDNKEVDNSGDVYNVTEHLEKTINHEQGPDTLKTEFDLTKNNSLIDLRIYFFNEIANLIKSKNREIGKRLYDSKTQSDIFNTLSDDKNVCLHSLLL